MYSLTNPIIYWEWFRRVRRRCWYSSDILLCQHFNLVYLQMWQMAQFWNCLKEIKVQCIYQNINRWYTFWIYACYINILLLVYTNINVKDRLIKKWNYHWFQYCIVSCISCEMRVVCLFLAWSMCYIFVITSFHR